MKRNYALALVSVVILLIVSSFYQMKGTKQVYPAPLYIKSFPINVAWCSAIPNPADTAIEIPALKGWGNYHWKVTTEVDSAQFYFNQGISLYYAFHNIEAIASFSKATRLDPDCAMAWYGKALAMGPTINYSNGYQAPMEALAAAQKSKELMSACTPMEKDLIMAIQHRYSADTTISQAKLRQAYADAMKVVFNQHKKNVDAVTLYADGLMLLHPWDLYTLEQKPKPWTPLIRALLEQALVMDPKHPGANHYYIHTMEASSTPETAIKSAHLLDTLMPMVSHITHMPSHIYIRVGNFQRGLKVNDHAVAGFEQYVKAYAPAMEGFGLYKVHNIHLKNNCASMAGNYKIAIATADTIQKLIPAGFLAMKSGDGNYMQEIYSQPYLTNVRFGRWDEILKAPLVDTLAYVNALQHFSRGMAYSRQKDHEKAMQELKALENKMLDKSLQLNMDNFSSAYDALTVARFILKGVIAEDQQQHEEAVDFLREAVVAENRLIYIEPRAWPLPSRQYLGNALINAGQYDQAVKAFQADLKLNPKNGWSLTGLQQAYQKSGNRQALALINLKLKSAWAIKDLAIEHAVF
jgi:tetratricopeptide (TPR) repeat protein